VVLFAKRSIAPILPVAYQILAPNIHLLYLDELQNLETQSFGVKIVDLVVCKPKEVEKKVPFLLSEARSLSDISLRATMLDLIETILVYKFENLSRKELEAMFGLSELKQTRVYQEAKEEGVQLGRQEGVQLGRQEGVQLGRQEGVQLGRQEGVQLGRQSEARLLIRLLSKRFGILSKRLQSKITALPLEKMEDLGEMLLDFTAIADLETWLKNQK
jgi:predicted transposase YdaD